MDTITIIDQAFKNLRKRGFVCRKNFSCCGNCAGYELTEQVVKMKEAKRAKFQGVIFWHRQDTDTFKRHGKLYIRYGPVDSDSLGELGLSAVDVGLEFVKELTTLGFPKENIEWDGDGDKTIKVNEIKEPEPVINDVPLKFDKKYYEYLDKLRASGVTNMWGAGAYVERHFGIDYQEAREILGDWMRTFSARHKPVKVS